MDYFTRLGLPRRFDLDLREIEANYFRLSRLVHPDHQAADESAQTASVQSASLLNEAFKNIRNPFTRAEHLLELLGGPSASENKVISQTLLMEMMEIREQIESANQNRDENLRTSLSEGLSSRYKDLLEATGKEFGAEVPNLGRIRELLNSAKYVLSMLRDLDD